MIRLGLAVAVAACGFHFLGVSAADAAATRFFDPQTKTWQEITPGRSKRNPVPRQVIDYEGPHKPNTIIVETSERRLYYVMEDGKALKYGVGARESRS